MALNQININDEVYNYQFTEDGEDICIIIPQQHQDQVHPQKSTSYKNMLVKVDDQPYEFDTIDFVIIDPITRYIIGEYIGNDEDYDKHSFSSSEFYWYGWTNGSPRPPPYYS